MAIAALLSLELLYFGELLPSTSLETFRCSAKSVMAYKSSFAAVLLVLGLRRLVILSFSSLGWRGNLLYNLTMIP